MSRKGQLGSTLLLFALAVLPLLAAGRAQDQLQAEPQPAAAETQAENWQIPGTFTQGTSLADLEARFGAENVLKVTLAADASDCEVVVFPDDSARRLHATYYDCEKLDQLRSIEVRDRETRWLGKGGVHVGMSFDELRERNGKAFGFTGFDRAGIGRAHDQWSPATDDDATIGKLDVGAGERMYFDVMIGLRADATAPDRDKLPRDDYFPSDDPRIPQLAPLLEVVSFGASTSLDDEWD